MKKLIVSAIVISLVFVAGIIAMQAANATFTGPELAARFGVANRPSQITVDDIQTVLGTMPGIGKTTVAALVSAAPITNLEQLKSVTWKSSKRTRTLSEKKIRLITLLYDLK